MPEIELSGGEYWLAPAERIEKCFPLSSERRVGLITSRRGSKLFYASVLTLGDKQGYRFDMPRWEHTELRKAICESIEQAEATIRGTTPNDA